MWKVSILLCLLFIKVVESGRIPDSKWNTLEGDKSNFVKHSGTKETRIKEIDLENNCTDQNICCGYSKEPSQRDGSFEHPNHMLKLMDCKPETLTGSANKHDFANANKDGKESRQLAKTDRHHFHQQERKLSKRKNPSQKHKNRKKTRDDHMTDRLVPDTKDNSSQDRWRKQKLKQLPEVARLEQRLHPTVRNPIHNMMDSMDRILQTMRQYVRRADLHYHRMFNITRYDIMMNLREELKTIAEGNNQAYDAVLQASLLTKDIYRRAHRGQLVGPKTIPAAAAASRNSHELRQIPMREIYTRAAEEARLAEKLKDTLASANREKYNLETKLIEIQRQVEEKLRLRVLEDLIRISNQTSRVLETISPTFGVGGRIHLYGHMHRNGIDNAKEARDLIYNAKRILSLAKTEGSIGRNLRNQIQRQLSPRTPGVVSDMPYDETRMRLWALADSARHHSDNLFMAAANIHMKLAPLLKKGREIADNSEKGSFSRKLDDKVGKLKVTIQALLKTLDNIRVIIDNEGILRTRCEDIQNSEPWLDVNVIDCDEFIFEGSGNETVEGSGDMEDTYVDVEIPMVATPVKEIMHINPSNVTTGGKLSIENGGVLNADVTRTSDDEDLFTTTKKAELKTTTVAPVIVIENKTEEILEEGTEDEEFTFTDWFGILGDDPKVLLHHSNSLHPLSSLNELIVEKLAVYRKTSREVLGETNKTKENIKDLQAHWNRTSISYRGFEDNVFATKVFLHGWAAKKLSFDALHERVITQKDSIDLISIGIKKQCADAIDVADKKLEAAEERRDKQTHTEETQADPDDVKAAKESVAAVKTNIQEMIRLKHILPDPCKTIQNLDSVMRTNISELRQKIERAKLITSTLQIPVSVKDSAHLKLPLDADDKFETSSTTLELDVKPGDSDGLIAAVQTTESVSFAVSVQANNPILSVFDKDYYEVGKTSSELQLDKDTVYRILAERSGSLFSLSIFISPNNSLFDNASVLVDSIYPYQHRPSTVYVAGATGDFPFGSWDGCVNQLSVNGRFLNLLQRDSIGNLPTVCSNKRVSKREQSIVLGGSGYAKYDLEQWSQLNHGAIDDLHLTFKAYSDGVLVHMKSSLMGAVETIEVQNEKLLVSFKNKFGQTTLQSKQDVFKYGGEAYLKINAASWRQPSIEVLLNGVQDAFESTQHVLNVDSSPGTGLYIGGLPSSSNRSLHGCIRSMSINSQEMLLSSAVSLDNVYYGQCMEESCFKFVEDSLPIDLGDDTGRDSILLTFMFGSSGTLLEYSKLEKFTLRITVDDEGLDLYETKGNVSEKINLNNKSSGDLITVQIITSSNEIEIRVDDESKKISYDSGGGFWFFSDDSDDKYKILFGGSSNDGARFMGKLINFFIKGRPLDMAAYQTSNSLERCVPPSPPREERVKETIKDRDHFTC